MSQTIASRNISQTVRLGHRLIKFRYGFHKEQASAVSAASQVGGTASHSVSKASQGSQESIWDFQIPARWRRAPLSEEECAVINNGGRL